MSRALLITGATGKQGGALIKALLAENAGFQLLAVTRDASSQSAQKLAAKSSQVTVVQGNLDDPEAIFRAARKATKAPIWGVFSVQSFTPNKAGNATEERQGKDLIDASIANKVKYFVYSSADRGGARSIDNATDVPHFVTKHHIEHHLLRQAKGTDMRWTILRPVAFMDNFEGGFLGKVFATCWRGVVKSRPLQIIATSDIGVFAAKVFVDPTSYFEQSVSLAGDELTYAQMDDVFKEKTGSGAPATFGFLGKMVMWMSEEMGTMFAFMEREGFGADISEMRRVHPGTKTFSAWLEESTYVKRQ